MDLQHSRIDHPEHGSPRILVAGEALIDMVSVEDCQDTYRAIPGGSPFNIAIGLSRLNIPTGFLGKLSTDPLGQQLKTALQDNGVKLDFVQDDSGPTQLALVTRRPGNEPQHVFYGHQSADANLLPEDLPVALPDSIHALHFGSLSLISRPTGTALTQLMRRENQHRVISLDPNVRPSRIPDMEAYKLQLEEWVQLSHIVKLSQADLDVVYPESQTSEIIHRWLTMGPMLVVVTQGKNGATGYTTDGSVHAQAPIIQLVDSIGAGDAFMSGLLASLHDQDRLSLTALVDLDAKSLRCALLFAVQVAASTCKRQGADPPHRAQLAL
ncbi:carbohydrate kinase [Candidatus Bipolaricaulota bacterium]|nr:carbohydrate kinase [Candidatus Bipolaricaulota bacterium]